MNNTLTPPIEPIPSPMGSSHVVDLGDVLDISSLGAFRQILEQALVTKQSPLVLCGERVTRVDGAALQLLASFYREANTRGCEVQWKDPSSALQRAVQLLGMSQWIGLRDAGLQ